MKTWKSLQSIVIYLLITLIISYIVVDFFFAKPKIEKEVNDVKIQYKELSCFLDKKIPQIDSTFSAHTDQINVQQKQLNELKTTFNNFKE